MGQRRVVRLLPTGRRQGRQPFAELLSDLPGGFLRRFVADYHAQPVRFHQANVLNPGGRTLQAEQREVVGEVGAGELFYGFGFGLGHLLAAGIAFLAGAFGYADHGGQRALQHLVALVGGPLHGDAVGGAVNLQLADVADVGQAHQLGDLRPHLSGFGVAAIAPAHDEVGRFALQGQRKGLRRRQGVAASQRPVGQQHGPVGAQGVALSEPLGGVGRAHGQGHHAVGVAVFQVNGHVDAQQVEGVDFRRDAFPLDNLVFVVELYAGNHGHVFDADGYFHRGQTPWDWPADMSLRICWSRRVTPSLTDTG